MVIKKWMKRVDCPFISYLSQRFAHGGSKKNIKSLGESIYEIKINLGPGYRVYFGELERKIVLLVTGGDKKNQSKDIKLAKEYWRLYAQK
jgi:putative addiction module killer protein